MKYLTEFGELVGKASWGKMSKNAQMMQIRKKMMDVFKSNDGGPT